MMKNDTAKTVRGLLIAGVVVMAVSILWPSLAEKYGTSKQTTANTLQTETTVKETETEAEMEMAAEETEGLRIYSEPVFRVEHDENGNAYSHTDGGGSTGSFVNGTSGTSAGTYSSSGSASNESSYESKSNYKNSSSYKSSLDSKKKYDPYDAYDYDDADDFADDWAEEFGDGDYDDGYDEAYDYWEDEMDD